MRDATRRLLGLTRGRHAAPKEVAPSALGILVGKTDELGLNVVEDKIHIHDLQATILHSLGLEHTHLTYRHMGRDFRLTDVGGHVVKKLLRSA